jgi:hypothetical protein
VERMFLRRAEWSHQFGDYPRLGFWRFFDQQYGLVDSKFVILFLFGLFGRQTGYLLELDSLFGKGGFELDAPRAKSCFLFPKLVLELRHRGLTFHNLRRSPVDLVSLFFERRFESELFVPLIAGLSLKLGARREQPLASHDFHVFSKAFAFDFCPREDPSGLLLGIGHQSECGATRATPQYPDQNQSEDRDQQHTERRYQW